jgi:hypothetical protein
LKRAVVILLLLIAFTFFTTQLSPADSTNIQKHPSKNKSISYCSDKRLKLYTNEDYRRWFKVCGRLYDVDPYFLEAVAVVESRRKGIKNRLTFYVGRIGRHKQFVGPMAIHVCFERNKYGFDIYDPYDNIEFGASALRGVGYNTAAQKKRLKKYNTEFKSSYFLEILTIRKELQAISSIQETRG